MPVTLTLLHFNAWSGSTYSMNWLNLSLKSYELPSQTEARYHSAVRQIRELDPDVITVNECMPSPAYASRLAEDLGMDVFTRTGMAGAILGPVHFPSSSATEGDAVLARKSLRMRPLGREKLTGNVFGETFSLNGGDATQVIAAAVVKDGEEFVIGCTHWTASAVDCEATRREIEEMRVERVEMTGGGKGSNTRFTEKEIEEGEAAVERGTATRVEEARLTLEFLDKVSSDLPGSTVILAGDLNTVAGTPELEMVGGVGGEGSAYEPVSLPEGSVTWDVLNPNVALQDKPEYEGSRGRVEERLYTTFSKRNACLDHVFVKGWRDEVGEKRKVEAEGEVCMKGGGSEGGKSGGAVASDHYGVLVTFRVPDRAAGQDRGVHELDALFQAASVGSPDREGERARGAGEESRPSSPSSPEDAGEEDSLLSSR